MHEIATGPLLWISFAVCIGGSLFRLAEMFRLAGKEKVIYPFMTLRHSLRSIAHWIVPFASRNMRLRPAMTIATFSFHLSLLTVPVFLVAHNVLLSDAWGVSLWTIPEIAADVMSLVAIAGCALFVLRRALVPEVRYVTTTGDYALLLIIALPFVTGFIAHHQFFAYKTMLTLHILCGEVMLIAIPFTRLSHMFYFFFTRAWMGCEFGAVRHARDW
ncbi:MAG: TmcC family electron transfer complex membrane anchor subunit [Elusimicrobiota bacterium]